MHYLKTCQPYLNSEQVDELLKDGFSIGAHSIDHPSYACLPAHEQFYQTVESTKLIQQRFSLPYRAFSFPFNDTGLSKRYFDQIYRKNLLDVSFGVGGMKKDVVRNNLQRLWMERESVSAKRILTKAYLTRFIGILTGQDNVIRN
jgi:peptidoglycan/xylan/chitin deacetylase (PgdA/CDA1 family)